MSLTSPRKLMACALAGGMIIGLPLLVGSLKVAYDLARPFAPWDRLRAALEPTKRTGGRIVVQLERFRSEHGHYPERLDDLVPDYLPAIPRAF